MRGKRRGPREIIRLPKWGGARSQEKECFGKIFKACKEKKELFLRERDTGRGDPGGASSWGRSVIGRTGEEKIRKQEKKRLSLRSFVKKTTEVGARAYQGGKQAATVQERGVQGNKKHGGWAGWEKKPRRGSATAKGSLPEGRRGIRDDFDTGEDVGEKKRTLRKKGFSRTVLY